MPPPSPRRRTALAVFQHEVCFSFRNSRHWRGDADRRPQQRGTSRPRARMNAQHSCAARLPTGAGPPPRVLAKIYERTSFITCGPRLPTGAGPPPRCNNARAAR